MTIMIKSNTFFLDIEKERSSRTVSSSNTRNFTRKLKDKAIYSLAFIYLFFFLMHRRNILLHVRRYAELHRTHRFDIDLVRDFARKKKRKDR